MNKIKISHETPLSLLDKSIEFNDYQYVLPHLIDKYPQYGKFMLNYRKLNDSFIIMDNGLFEGVTHTEKDLEEKINLVKPNIFITPDAWNDSQVTLDNAKHWINKNIGSKTNLMVVLQGKKFNEMVSLFHKAKNLGYKHFAINHSSIAYQNEQGEHSNPLVNQMIGRQQFVDYLYSHLDENDYIHLLGCSLPQEFLFYKGYSKYKNIKSLDTSNPIIFGALNKRYSDFGMTEKPSMKIEEILNMDTDKHISDIMFNVKTFKSFVNG